MTLDTVVGAFRRGATPEEIAQDYAPLSLADVYSVIAYYLRHQGEVEEYLERRRSEHEELRKEIESASGHQELRQRLKARIERLRTQPT